MKATGIVRRIDDLGRVVIPKEIRRTLRIREGDPLEIFTDRNGEVILKKYSPTKILTYLFFFTALILLPSIYIERNMYVIDEISVKAIVSLLYMGIFSSLIAFLLQQKGIKKIGPVKAAVYTNLIPIYSIILSALILDEKVTIIQITAMLLVMFAIMINMKKRLD